MDDPGGGGLGSPSRKGGSHPPDLSQQGGARSGRQIFYSNATPVQLEKFRSDFSSNRNYDKFFILSTVDKTKSMMNINTIQANRELLQQLGGTPSDIRELRSGDLLVEVLSPEQSRKIAEIKQLANTDITVTSNDKMNQCQATIYYRNDPHFTEEEIKQHLNETNEARVTNVYRMTKKVDGASIPMNVYLLTFQTTELPPKVTIGWTKCSTRLYIPRPRRCFKCQEFGHSVKTCRRQLARCVQCAVETDPANNDHPQPCTAAAICANCGESHSSNSPNCPRYQTETLILKVKTEQRLTYPAARRRVLGTDRSYSTIARPNARLTEMHHQAKQTPPQQSTSNTQISPDMTGGSTAHSQDPRVAEVPTDATLCNPTPSERSTFRNLTFGSLCPSSKAAESMDSEIAANKRPASPQASPRNRKKSPHSHSRSSKKKQKYQPEQTTTKSSRPHTK